MYVYTFFAAIAAAAYAAGPVRTKKRRRSSIEGGTGNSDQFDRGGFERKRHVSGTFLILRVRLFQ